MKSCRFWILFAAGTAACGAQTNFPGNPTVGPKKYSTREVGGGTESGASLEPPKGGDATKYVTHIVLYDLRFWTSVEGKPLAGKLIAFEDLVVETPKGAVEPQVPAPPARPTLVKNGRIRLLVDKKPVEVPLDRLSWQDREFIDGIQAALDKKAGE